VNTLKENSKSLKGCFVHKTVITNQSPIHKMRPSHSSKNLYQDENNQKENGKFTFFSKVFSSGELVFVRNLFIRLFLILFIYFLLRVVFLIIHWETFQTYYFRITAENIFLIFLTGLEFDFVVILFINLPVILLHLLPIPWRNYKLYKAVVKLLFIGINAVFIFVAVADLFYYQHAMVRSSGAILGMLDGFTLMLVHYSMEYWYAWILLVLFVVFLYWCDRSLEEPGQTRWSFSIQLMIFFCVFSFSFLTASRITGKIPPKVTAAASNTPFIIINDLFQNGSFFSDRNLPEYEYFSTQEAEEKIGPLKNYFYPDQPSELLNVFIIVLESFSKQYIGYFQEQEKRSHTPFLDSLSSKSLVFFNAFANAKQSNQAISAIYVSIPTMMRQPMITSRYKYNNINGIASLLGQVGYSSAFFMGSPNGLYGYDFFTRRAGFQKYFGKNEYGNDEHYDGAWGIYDDKFFLFTADRLNEMSEPFVASLWSVSSHHPFLIPPDYEDDLEKAGDHPIMKTVRYTDHSLKLFFEKIREMPWYENTLFVITADHTAITNNHTPYHSTALGTHRIPLLFYKPGSELTGVRDDFVQHIDIVPSVVDYLNLDITFKSMGKSVFHNYQDRYVYHYYNRLFQIADDTFFIQFDGERVISIYNHREDSLMQDNLLYQGEDTQEGMLEHLKAVIQFYNHAMNRNGFVKRR